MKAIRRMRSRLHPDGGAGSETVDVRANEAIRILTMYAMLERITQRSKDASPWPLSRATAAPEPAALPVHSAPENRALGRLLSNWLSPHHKVRPPIPRAPASKLMATLSVLARLFTPNREGALTFRCPRIDCAPRRCSSSQMQQASCRPALRARETC